MRKLVLSMFTSLDGYVCGPNGEFRAPQWSDDLGKHWSGYALGRAGHLLYGRVNFEFNKAFWAPAVTDPSSPAAAIDHAAPMNVLRKTVLSRTLTGDPGWNGVVARDLGEAVATLKASDEPGDVFCFGGAEIAHALVSADMPDEYMVMVLPTLWGDGKKLFPSGFSPLELELAESHQLDTGAVVMRYARRR